jgi:hypothetical protein
MHSSILILASIIASTAVSIALESRGYTSLIRAGLTTSRCFLGFIYTNFSAVCYTKRNSRLGRSLHSILHCLCERCSMLCRQLHAYSLVRQFSVVLHLKCSMCLQYLHIRLLFWASSVFGCNIDNLRATPHINYDPNVPHFTNHGPPSRRRLHTVIYPLCQWLPLLRRQFNAHPALWKLPSRMYFQFPVRIQHLR